MSEVIRQAQICCHVEFLSQERVYDEVCLKEMLIVLENEVCCLQSALHWADKYSIELVMASLISSDKALLFAFFSQQRINEFFVCLDIYPIPHRCPFI